MGIVDTIGPVVDCSAIQNGIRCIGLYDTPYNRHQLNSMSMDVIYELGIKKIKFHFDVNGFNLADGYDEEQNMFLNYYYSCYLVSMEQEGDYWETSKYMNRIGGGLPNCREYFRQLLQINDIIFFTDLLFDYLFMNNSRNMTEDKFNDLKFLNKLRDSYRKEQNMQEDFK